LIGNDAGYPLDGKYYLTNDIIFGDLDLNGGVDIDMVAEVIGPDLKITLTPVDGSTVSSFYSALGVSTFEEDPAVGNTWTMNSVQSGTYTLIIGGELSSGEMFAYHIDGIDTTVNNTVTKTFNSNGNFDPIAPTSANPFTGIFDGNGHVISGAIVAQYSASENADAAIFDHAGDGAKICNLGVVNGSSTVVGTQDHVAPPA
jgi:hypothetical protein